MRGNFLYKKIGASIMIERKRRCWSQESLAADTSLDRTYLARIEEGKANPSVKVLYKIARKMGIKIHQLLYKV